MNQTHRLMSLQSQKQELENQIHDETAHPAYNVFCVMELKKRKLMILDEIERLAHAS